MVNHQVNFARWQASDLEPEGYRPSAISYHSTVMELVVKSCERLNSPAVLQIGGVSSRLVEIVAKVKGKLVISDPKSDDGLSLLSYLEMGRQKFDTIFLWDNLLADGVPHKNELLSLLENCSKMGTSLVMFTTTRQVIPATQSKFIINDNSVVEIIPTTTQTIRVDFFDIAKQLPLWRCMRTTQLRNGFRESLLVKAN